MGDGGERERALDDVFWIKVSELRQNFAKIAKILRLSQKYSKTNLEIRANIRSAFKMFGQRVASLVEFLQTKNFFLSAERPRYELTRYGVTQDL